MDVVDGLIPDDIFGGSFGHKFIAPVRSHAGTVQ